VRDGLVDHFGSIRWCDALEQKSYVGGARQVNA
jgi:hypothetical protein